MTTNIFLHSWRNPRMGVWYVVSRVRKNANNLTKEDARKSISHWKKYHEMNYEVVRSKMVISAEKRAQDEKRRR